MKSNSGLVRPAEAAAWLGVHRKTLYLIAEREPDFPRKITLSARCVGWRREALEAWLAEREVAS